MRLEPEVELTFGSTFRLERFDTRSGDVRFLVWVGHELTFTTRVPYEQATANAKPIVHAAWQAHMLGSDDVLVAA